MSKIPRFSQTERWEESNPHLRRRWLFIALMLLIGQLFIAVLGVREGLTLSGICFGLGAIAGFSLFLWYGPYARRRD